MFIQEIASRFKNLRVQVTIDTNLLPTINDVDKVSTDRIVTFSLYKLIYAIGTIQTRRFAPSNRMKFIDKSDLIEKIYTDTYDFRVKLSEISRTGGQEVLTTISEDFGVGISVIIADSLFNIKFSTIQRIYGRDKRPDWKCQTVDNRTLIIESKGASSQATSRTQQTKALVQKNRRNGDVKIASLSVFNEHQISTNRFLDPPIEPENMDSRLQNKILRAGHYSSVFSFLGISVLSKYYSQMRNRLLKSISPAEQIEKNEFYFRLRDDYSIVQFENKHFTGSFYDLEDDKYLFVGIDTHLISYEGFLGFRDYENEIDETINQNHYILFKDGILLIEVHRISEFSDNVNIYQIASYQENITISDIDVMSEESFAKYINYLLRQIGFETQNEYRIQDTALDILGTRNNRNFAFELKLSKTKKFSRATLNQLRKFQRLENIDKVVFITNAKIQEVLKSEYQNIIIIDRSQLQQILSNKNILIERLNK